MPDYGIFIIAKWLSDKLSNNNTKKDSKEYYQSDIDNKYIDKELDNPDLVKQDYIAGKLSLDQYSEVLQFGFWMEDYLLRNKLNIDLDNNLISKKELRESFKNMTKEKIRMFNDKKNINEYERLIAKYRKMRGET